MFNYFNEIEAFFEQRKSAGIKPGLDRIKSLLQSIGNPEQKINGIHVAGTNGKGSTVQYIKHALIQNNYKVGVFTSPSSTGLTGHIMIDDAPIKEETFIDLMNSMYPQIKQLDLLGEHPTEFEIVTSLAFLYFSNSVDIALIEAGMGGREDTTNCFQPLLSIITNVSRDHMTFLGDTVEKIATHKAGIIKTNTPAIIGPMSDNTMKVMEKEANQKKAELYRFGREYECNVESGDSFTWKNKKKTMQVKLQMNGEHQKINASLAIMAINLLAIKGFVIDDQKVLKGIHHTTLQGRYELIHEQPRIIIDGAHNEAGILSFIKTARSTDTRKKKQVIFAAFKDKDINSMIHLLEQNFDSVIVTTFDHPRAATIDELAKYNKPEKVVVQDNWQNIMKTVLGSSNADTLYYVTGSLHFITNIRNFVAQQ